MSENNKEEGKIEGSPELQRGSSASTPYATATPLTISIITMSFVKKNLTSKVENVENREVRDLYVLDLPELVLECILERLPPPALCRMAGVCRSLRERCVSDHLWERHMKQKWGRVIGAAALRKWQWHIASKQDAASLKQGKQRGFMRLLSLPLAWPFSLIRSKVEAGV